MSLINTTDSSGSPNVPDATKTVAWKDYIWIRRLGTSGEARFYIWNEEAASDSTYLKWQEKSDVALTDLAVPDTQVIVGNSSGKAAAVAMSGNATITNAGVVTVGSVASGAITNAMVNNSAAVAYSKLNLTGAILNADLAGSIAEGKLAGSIPYSKLSIADGDIPFAKINNANITNGNMADMPANTVKVRDANSTGAASDKAVGDTQLLIGDGTGFTAAALSGDVTMANTGAVTIASNSVEGSMLNDNVADSATIERSGSGGTLSLKAAGVEVSHVKAHSSAGVLGYGSSGAAAAITADASSSGKVLKSNGNNAAPTFQSETSMVPMLEITHANPNSHWVVPTGVTKIKVCLQGAGAGGATDNSSSAGGGGGGGAYVEAEFNVSAGQVFMLKAGAGSKQDGGGSASTPFASGEATEFRQLTGTTTSNLDTTLRASAPGGSGARDQSNDNHHSLGGYGGVAPALTSPYNADGTTNYTKKVDGLAGGNVGAAFYGQSASGGGGGYGGASYKGQGALGGAVGLGQGSGNVNTVVNNQVVLSQAENLQLRGSGYGFGGQGTDTSQDENRYGGSGWGAIYDIS